MHQKETQQAIAQMPEIPRPDPLHLAAIGQLTKHRVDEVAYSPQHGTLIRSGLRCMSVAEWCLQDNAFRPQKGLQVGQPIIAITQHHTRRAFQQHRHNFAIGFISRCRKHPGQQTRPTQLRMQPKAIKGLAIRMIFAIACYATEAHTPGRTGKTADWQWHAIHYRQAWIVADQFVTQPAPEAFFDRPQIGGLSDEGATRELLQSREKVRVMPLKIGKQLFILRESQVASDHLYRDHFTVSQLRLRSSFSQWLSFRDTWHHLVNQAKTCDNKIVQTHEIPPQMCFVHCSEDIS